MGGLSGHMLHPYEDFNLKLSDILYLFNGIKNNQLNMEEKVDGNNLHLLIHSDNLRNFKKFSDNVIDIRIARSGGDLYNGGVQYTELETRFSHNLGFVNLIKSVWPLLKNFSKSLVESGTYKELLSSKKGLFSFPVEILRTNPENYQEVTNMVPYFTPSGDGYMIVPLGYQYWTLVEEMGRYEKNGDLHKFENTNHLCMDYTKTNIDTLTNITNHLLEDLNNNVFYGNPTPPNLTRRGLL